MSLFYSTHKAFQFAHQSHKDVQLKLQRKKMRASCLFKVGIFILVSFIEIQGDNLCTGLRSSGLLADLFDKDPTTGVNLKKTSNATEIHQCCTQAESCPNVNLKRHKRQAWQLVRPQDKLCCNSKSMGIQLAHNIRFLYLNPFIIRDVHFEFLPHKKVTLLWK